MQVMLAANKKSHPFLDKASATKLPPTRRQIPGACLGSLSAAATSVNPLAFQSHGSYEQG